MVAVVANGVSRGLVSVLLVDPAWVTVMSGVRGVTTGPGGTVHVQATVELLDVLSTETPEN